MLFSCCGSNKKCLKNCRFWKCDWDLWRCISGLRDSPEGAGSSCGNRLLEALRWFKHVTFWSLIVKRWWRLQALQRQNCQDGNIFSGRLQTMYFRKHFGHQLGKQMVTCAGPMVLRDWFLLGGPKRRKHRRAKQPPTRTKPNYQPNTTQTKLN